MRSRVMQTFAKYDDWRYQRRDLNADEEGLSLVAYALGAAFIVVPMAIALFLFGQQTTTRRECRSNRSTRGQHAGAAVVSRVCGAVC